MSVDRSTIWPYKDGEPGEFIYQRYGHPTGVEAERRLGELDGGHALLFSSGSGATIALVLTLLSSGSAEWSASERRMASDWRSSAPARASSPRPIPARSCYAASRRSTCESAARRNPRTNWQGA